MRQRREAGATQWTRHAGLVLVAVVALSGGVAGRDPSPFPSRLGIPIASPATTLPGSDPVAPEPAPAAAGTTTTTSSGRRPSVPAATPPSQDSNDGFEPARLPLPAAHLQVAIERWLAGQSVARSVAVGVAFTGDAPWLWTGEAHLGDPLFHADDEYGVLSITKTFTEALVLREVAAGRIDLDAPMPAIAGLTVESDSPVVTPRMLLQHTSGLVNYPKAVGYDPSRPITPREIVSLALHSPLLSPPGRQARYSNTNFHWLGLLLEQVTGRSYADLVAGLAADIGLTDTWLDPTGRPGWIGYSSGGIRSTVGDVARWGAALFTPGRVLPAEELTEFTTVGDAGVSLGLWPLCPCSTGRDGARHPAALRQTVAHGGFFFFPDRDLVVVVHYEPAGAGAGAADAAAAALAGALEDLRGGPPAG